MKRRFITLALAALLAFAPMSMTVYADEVRHRIFEDFTIGDYKTFWLTNPPAGPFNRRSGEPLSGDRAAGAAYVIPPGTSFIITGSSDGADGGFNDYDSFLIWFFGAAAAAFEDGVLTEIINEDVVPDIFIDGMQFYSVQNVVTRPVTESAWDIGNNTATITFDTPGIFELWQPGGWIRRFIVSDTAPNITTANTWAHESINTAFTHGLIPHSLQSNYTRATTRAEFAAFAVALYETATGREITERTEFIDTNDINVQKMGGLGVVTGVGGGNFAPNDILTREQSAVMLARLASAIVSPCPHQLQPLPIMALFHHGQLTM